MNYRIGQYNHLKSSEIEDTNKFIEVIKSNEIQAKPYKISTSSDSEDSGISTINRTEKCIKLMGGSGTNSFDSTTIYYLHAKIKRLNSNMTIYVKLANTANKNSPTQYLRTINIKGGNTSEWYDFEIIFKPIANFDCVVFQLQRTNEDYTADGYRNLVILYEELSKVQNFKANLTENNIIKLGVQSRPGLLMCINGQEIHVGRSGIYEIRNGIVYVDFFSIIKAAEEEEGEIKGLYRKGNNLEELLKKLASGDKELDAPVDDSEDTDSDCIFNHPKKRTINTFTIDYMYEVKDDNE